MKIDPGTLHLFYEAAGFCIKQSRLILAGGSFYFNYFTICIIYNLDFAPVLHLYLNQFQTAG